MAETKRNSTAGKVATPKTGGSSGAAPNASQVAVNVNEGLASAIGARVRLTLVSNPSSPLEGTLFTACPILNVVAINTKQSTPASQSGDYHVIPVSQIQNVQILSLAPTGENSKSALTAIGPIDVKRLKEREDTRIKQLHALEKDKGKGVTKEAQAIFDAFKRINMPIRWHNQEMIVDNSVIISEPYRAEDCRASKDKQQALSHIRRVLDGERRKLKDKEERERAAGGPRKGG